MELTLQEEQAVRAVQPTNSPALAASSPAAIMLSALERGVSPADLRDMLALQREWQADQARAAFHEALAAFKAEPITIAKTKAVGYASKKTGEWVGYKHAELADVVAIVGPALARHGLSHRWDVKQSKDWVHVTCILSHRLGHSERIEMGGPPDNSGNKSPLQQIASTTTFLQRHTLKAITGVAEGGEDDDAGGANAQLEEEARRQQAQGQPEDAAAKPFYAADDFEKNLPAWRKAIAAGKKTADDVITTVESKGRLTDEQKAAIRA
jgi:hypothetical protein